MKRVAGMLITETGQCQWDSSKTVALLHIHRAGDENAFQMIGLGYVASALRKAGYRPISVRDVDEAICFGVSSLGISSASQDYDLAVSAAQRAQEAGLPVCIGGAHANAGPEYWVQGIDHLPGMGETEILGWLEGRPAGPIKHLDELPFPDRDFGRSPAQAKYLLTSRGCAFRCAFCQNSAKAPGIMYHSAERVFAEMKELAAKGMRRITIWDDLFAGNYARLASLAAMKADCALTRDVELRASMHAKLATPKVLAALVYLGCRRSGIGAEHAVDRILRQLKGPAFSVVENEAALKRMRDHGMTPGSGFIFGHPDETEADVVATYEWIMRGYDERWLTNHVVNVLTPLPGTAVWQLAHERGLMPADFRWPMLRHAACNYGLFRDVYDWAAVREAGRCIYLNEANVPWPNMVQILAHYEDRIMRGDYGKLYHRPRNMAYAAVRRGRGRLSLVRSRLRSRLG